MATLDDATNRLARKKCLRWVPVALVLLTVLFVGYVRWRIADTPLERDEGEYAYGGQLILHGTAPYKDLYNIKLPGTYAAYAILMALFGETPVGIHLGLAVVNAASIALMYLVAKRISGATAGVLAAVFFAFITLDPSILGFAAQATHFVVLAALGGVYFLVRAIESGRVADVWWSGFLMGVSFLCKQPGLFFGVMGFAFVVWLAIVRSKPSLRVLYGVGWLVPYVVVCVLMWAGGCFETFWIWTTKYAGSHGEHLSNVIPALRNHWSNSAPWLQCTAVACVISLVYLVLNKRLARWKRWLLVAVTLAGLLAISPGFSFYRHYFIMLAPGVALAIAVALAEFTRQAELQGERRGQIIVPIIAGICWIAWVVASLQNYMFVYSAEEIVGRRYEGNPFLQTRVIGKYLEERAAPGARIAVFQSEPEILFYARRRSATGFIYAYDMTALGAYRAEMERQFKREVVQANPEYVVFICCPYSWSILDDAGMQLADWCWKYPQTNFTRVAVADNLGPNLRDTVFKFDADAAHYTSRFASFIQVYRRNN